MNDKDQAILLQMYDAKHLRNLMGQKKVLDLIYAELSKEAAKIGKASGFDDEEAEFHFEDYPNTNKLIEKLIAQHADKIEAMIVEGNQREWLLSNEKNAKLVKALTKGKKISKEQIAEWTQPHLDALSAFQDRKVSGMGLSERVWNLATQTKQELELALDIGLGEGKSAAELSRDVRSYLNEPNKLFRRVRDKHGNLRLSKAAAAYHPGQGVYRSSYKNALRMTATENNMAYRTSDHTSWQKLDFVIGQKVQLSNNHTIKNAKGQSVPFHDICDEMAGDYPKDFKYAGWHPFCRCFVTPILADWNEQLKVMQMQMNGEDVSNYHFKGEITDVPPGYKKWMSDHAKRIASAKSMPYFIRDNYVGGMVGGGFKWEAERQRATIMERAAMRHAARTPEQIQDIQDRWALREDELQYTPEQRSMFRVIEKRLGIKRGFSMPYLRADEQSANPNYDKDFGYHINCQTCAPAYQLRLWGFDITAKANPKKVGNLSTYLSTGNNWRETWVDENFKHIGTKTFNEFLREKGYKQMTAARYKEYFKEVCTEDGVYEIGLVWKGGAGHCTIIERKNGKFRYIEPQLNNARGSKREWDDFDNLCNSLTPKPFSKDGVIRCDNALFDKKFLEIFEPNKAVPLHTQRVLNAAAERHAARTDKEIKAIKEAWKQRKAAKDIFFKIDKVTTADELKALRTSYTGTDASVRKAFINKAAEIRHAARNDEAVTQQFKEYQKRIELERKTAENIIKVAKDYPYVDSALLSELAAKNRTSDLKAETQRLAKEMSAIKKWEKEVSEYIPNVKVWEKQFSQAELSSVRDNVIKNLDKWENAWNTDPYLPKKYATKEDYFLHKLTTELTYVATTGKTKYVTWQVAEEAYAKQFDIVNTKLWQKSTSVKIQEMEAFAASHKKSPIFATKLVELKDAAAAGDKYTYSIALAELEQKKHDLELRDAQRARKKQRAAYGNPNERKDLRKSAANDEQLFKAAAAILKDKKSEHPELAAELENALNSKQRDKVLSLTKKMGEDLDNPYNQYRKDAAVWFKNSRDAHEHFFPKCQEAWANGTDEERYAGYNYTEGSEYLTNSLRGNDGWCYDLIYARKSLDIIKRDAVALTSWIAKNKFDEDIWVKRDERSSITNDVFGIKLDDYKADYIARKTLTEKIEALEKVKKIADPVTKEKVQNSIDRLQSQMGKLKSLEGTVGVDESFASTGNNKDTWFGRKDVCLNIYCPNGTHGIYASPFSHYEGNGGYHFDGKSKFIYYSENEILLQRGNNLRITKVEWNEDDQRWYIDVEILEQNPREIIDWQTDALSTEGRYNGCRAIFKK